MKKQTEGILLVAAAFFVLLISLLRLGPPTEIAVLVLLGLGLYRMAGK